jgi:hypothetical protein
VEVDVSLKVEEWEILGPRLDNVFQEILAIIKKKVRDGET